MIGDNYCKPTFICYNSILHTGDKLVCGDKLLRQAFCCFLKPFSNDWFMARNICNVKALVKLAKISYTNIALAKRVKISCTRIKVCLQYIVIRIHLNVQHYFVTCLHQYFVNISHRFFILHCSNFTIDL